MGVGMWMTWGRPGWGEKGRRGGEEQDGTGESWMGGGTWKICFTTAYCWSRLCYLVFVTSRLVMFVQVALESKRFVTALALVVLE